MEVCMDIFMEMRQEIERLAEKDYKTFSASLVPGVEHMLGVRLPQLRQRQRLHAENRRTSYHAAEPSAQNR